MLFDTLYFVILPVGQVKLKNNLLILILASLGQALISNPVFYFKHDVRASNVIVFIGNPEVDSLSIVSGATQF